MALSPWKAKGTEVFLGRDWFSQRPGYAETTGREIDRQVRDLARQSLQQAVDLLESKRTEMDRLVDALIEEETLQGDRFMDLAGLA